MIYTAVQHPSGRSRTSDDLDNSDDLNILKTPISGPYSENYKNIIGNFTN